MSQDKLFTEQSNLTISENQQQAQVQVLPSQVKSKEGVVHHHYTPKTYTKKLKAKNLKLPSLARRVPATESSIDLRAKNSSRVRSYTQRTHQNSKMQSGRSQGNMKTLGNILGTVSPKQEELNLLFLKRRINNHIVTAESKNFNNIEKHIIYKSYSQQKVSKINPFMKEGDKNGSNLLNMTTDKKIFSRLKQKVDQLQELVSYSISQVNFVRETSWAKKTMKLSY